MLRECGKADAPAKTVLGRTSPSSNLFSLSENEFLSQAKKAILRNGSCFIKESLFLFETSSFLSTVLMSENSIIINAKP
jgi:hypothetical protein